MSAKLTEKSENKLEYKLAGFKDKTAEELSAMMGEFPGIRAEIIESVALGLSKEEAINAWRTSVVESEYMTFNTLNIKEQLLMKSLTVSNSTTGLCRNSWIER